MIFRSLKSRLIGGALVWISVGVILAGVSISALFREHVTELIDSELAGHLKELGSLITYDRAGHPVLTHGLSDPRFAQMGSGFYWQVRHDGAPLLHSASVASADLPAIPYQAMPEHVVRKVTQGPGGQAIVYQQSIATPAGGDAVIVEIGANTRIVDEVLAHFNQGLMVSFGLLAAALMAAAALQIGFGLQPMKKLRTALSAVRSGDAPRLPQKFPAEVEPLVDDLNELLEGNARMLQRARAQAGNLAHGLKTPLAILTDEAHRLQARGDEDAARVITQQCQRMQRQIDYQIARARAAASQSVPGAVAPVAPAVDSIVSAMKRLYAARSLSFEATVPTGLKVQCDPMDLNEMLANLIDNACKWAGGHVSISATRDDRKNLATIVVDDDGKGLSPESLEVVFQIGERLDDSMPGSGLGLPIVRDLAELYGGKVLLDQSPLGGLRATLMLPATVA